MSKHSPNNPPRLRRHDESAEEYRVAMGWDDPKPSMSQKRTPGPWVAEFVGSSSAGDDGEDVFEITNGHARIAEHVAAKDAPLLAAAPDLLDCLQRCLEEMAWIGPKARKTAEDSRAAIAKATGSAA